MKIISTYWTVPFLLVALCVTGAVPRLEGQESAPSSETAPTVKATAAESVIEIPLLDQQIVDQGQSISQVFLVSDDRQIFDKGTPKSIVVPPQIANENLAYVNLYFTGRRGAIEKGMIVLIADYNTATPTFYIDQNNNLDFSDDGKPVRSSQQDNRPILTLTGDKPGSQFSIRLTPFRGHPDATQAIQAKYLKLFQPMADYLGGELTDTENWYFNQRLNTKTNSVEVDGHPVLIGLHDYDCDGCYTGEKDRLLVGPYGAKTVSYALADGAVNMIEDEIFLIAQHPYRVISADDDGGAVRIARSPTMPERLFVGSRVPNLPLTSLDGQSTQLKEMIQPGKWLVLDFWGQWCAPCIASIPSVLEFHEKWKDQISFVGVHFGDHDIARDLVDEHGISFRQFESSDELEATFFIDAWPTYVVIDEQGEIVSFRSSLKEISQMLEAQH